MWATQAQIGRLFDVKSQAITKHIKNIYSDGELEKLATCSKMEQVQNEGVRKVIRSIDYYNLDAIIAVGYRVNSKKATRFRIWATKVLHDYLVNGYALHKHQLRKSPEGLEGLHEAIALIESKKLKGNLKGKITLKLTKNLVP